MKIKFEWSESDSLWFCTVKYRKSVCTGSGDTKADALGETKALIAYVKASYYLGERDE